MLRLVLMVLAVSSVAGTAKAQDIAFAGTHPPEAEVLALVQSYAAASAPRQDIETRDDGRRPLVSAGYFYHGWDGAPIGFDGLTARQIGNGLRVDESRFTDVILHQYESAAMVTYRTFNRGEDKGEPFESRGSGVIVMARENGEWKVLADIVGVGDRASELQAP